MVIKIEANSVLIQPELLSLVFCWATTPFQ